MRRQRDEVGDADNGKTRIANVRFHIRLGSARQDVVASVGRIDAVYEDARLGFDGL